MQFLFVFLYLSVLVSPELPESGLLFDTNLRIFCHCFKYYFLFLSFTSGILITCMLYLLRCSTVLTCVLSCFSHVWLCATLWTISCQAPLSMEFSRQGYWSGLPFPTPSRPRDRTHVSYISCIGRWVLYNWHHMGSPTVLEYTVCFQYSFFLLLRDFY